MLVKLIRRSFSMENKVEQIKFYYDFKSPYSFLAFDPAVELEKKFRVKIDFLPWPFRAEESFGGKLEERSRLNWNKVRYLYLDCRRFANERNLIIRGPERLFDSKISLIAGLFAQEKNLFLPFARRTFELFFDRKLNLENVEEIFRVFTSINDGKQISIDELKHFLEHRGAEKFDFIQKQAENDRVFGVPMFVFRDELFWGNDRLSYLEKRLEQRGLAR